MLRAELHWQLEDSEPTLEDTEGAFDVFPHTREAVRPFSDAACGVVQRALQHLHGHTQVHAQMPCAGMQTHSRTQIPASDDNRRRR